MIAAEHTKTLPTYTFIFTNSLNNIYLPFNHIRNPSSHYNHPYKLLVTQIINMLKTSHHNISICKAIAHTYTVGNDDIDKLAQKGA
jgi:hypothetical protein